MVVTKGSDEEIKASVEFLKWFTKPENNIDFSVGSGYLPVTNEANSIDKIKSVESDISSSMEEILTKSVEEIIITTCIICMHSRMEMMQELSFRKRSKMLHSRIAQR